MNRIQVLVVAALFALIASCTTNQAALFPPLPEVEVHLISESPAASQRTIASATGDSALEAEFQEIMASDNVDKIARHQVDRIVRLFYRTQAFLDDYDAKIDEVSKQENPNQGALQTDDTYARLISAWSLREEALEKISYFYKRALEIEMNRGGDTPVSRGLQDRAMLMNRAIRNTILSASNSTNRLAKQELLRELINVNREFRESQIRSGHKDVGQKTAKSEAVLSKQLIDDPNEMQAFYERNKRQLQRETEASKKDGEISQEVERLVPETKRVLTEQFQQRTPQSRHKIAPGLGPSGMMNGFEFPRGTWAITYDDGPHANYTLQAIANLKAQGMKATFFWIANNVSRMQSVVDQAVSAGMTLANHSYSHANLPRLGPAGLAREIIDSTTVDLRAGFQPKFFRCPYGACGSQTSVVRQKIAALNMISVTWNVDSVDWQDKNPSTVYARVKKQMAVQKRGIILFHDIHSQSITASKMLMADFAAGQKKGIYRTVTIEQAFNELNSPEGMK